MFALILLGLICTLFGIAFPWLLPIAITLWAVFALRAKSNLRKAEDKRKVKTVLDAQRRRDKALRYFSS